jgi:pyruvate/2-oxoglutarate dehydrogenase complex dihydrolipoamide dehydrogenase (E3) component
MITAGGDRNMNSTIIQPEEYDLVVLGSGEAGKYIAWTMAKQGQSVALIEREYVGGSCPNIACLPSKNVIHSAKVASYFWRSEEFGIAKEHVKINMFGVRDRKRRMVNGLIELGLGLFKTSGANLVMGSGRFVGPKTLEVTQAGGVKRVFRGKRVVISTGSRATIDSTLGLREATPLTQYRIARTGYNSGTFVDSRWRLCRLGICSGDAPIRQPCDDH